MDTLGGFAQVPRGTPRLLQMLEAGRKRSLGSPKRFRWGNIYLMEFYYCTSTHCPCPLKRLNAHSTHTVFTSITSSHHQTSSFHRPLPRVSVFPTNTK